MKQEKPKARPKVGGKSNVPLVVKKLTKKKKTPTIKYQIRSILRLLSKETLAVDMRANLEAKLDELKSLLAKKEISDKERKFALRYHKVKFFERVKITREIKRVKRKLHQDAIAAADRIEAEKRLALLQDDIEYIKYFPKLEKYVSLLTQGKTPEEQKTLEAKRESLRAIVKQRKAEEAVLAEMDEGRSNALPVPEAVIISEGKKSAAEALQMQKPKLKRKRGIDQDPASHAVALPQIDDQDLQMNASDFRSLADNDEFFMPAEAPSEVAAKGLDYVETIRTEHLAPPKHLPQSAGVEEQTRRKPPHSQQAPCGKEVAPRSEEKPVAKVQVVDARGSREGKGPKGLQRGREAQHPTTCDGIVGQHLRKGEAAADRSHRAQYTPRTRAEGGRKRQKARRA